MNHAPGRFTLALSWLQARIGIVAFALVLNACSGPQGPSPILGTWERERIDLSVNASEPVQAIYVEKGQQVAPGELLIQLDPTRQQYAISAAQAEVELAWQHLLELQQGPRREEIERVQAELSGATARQRTATSELTRQQALFQRGLSNASALDQAQLNVASAQAQQQALAAQLAQLLAGTRDEQVAQAQAQWQHAQAQVAQLETELERLSVRAPRQATVDSLPTHVGELASSGSVLISLLDAQRAYARVYVPLALRQQLHPGHAAQIQFAANQVSQNGVNPMQTDAVQTVYPGRLRWVASDAAFTPFYALNRHDQGHLVYLAEVELSQTELPDIPVGIPLEVAFASTATPQ